MIYRSAQILELEEILADHLQSSLQEIWLEALVVPEVLVVLVVLVVLEEMQPVALHCHQKGGLDRTKLLDPLV
jgi:hypothetical protein